MPPGLQAALKLGLQLDRIDKGLDPRHSGLGGGLVAANPLKQLDQPDMALGQAGIRVQRMEQGGQVLHGQIQRLTLMQHPAGRAAAVVRLQHKHRDRHVESFAVFGHAKKTAVHGAAGGAQTGAAGVLEGLTRFE